MEPNGSKFHQFFMTESIEQQNTGYTLATWLDYWLVTYKECSVKPKTYGNYAYAISLIKKSPQATAGIEELFEPDLQGILNMLYKRGYSKSTIRVVRLTLRQAYRKVLRLPTYKEKIDDNPCDSLVLPDAAVKKIFPLTHAQEALVCKACASDPLGDAFIFLLRTGLRRSELINLKWNDYDSGTAEIRITKSKTPAGIRTVPLISEAVQIIERQSKINDNIFNCTRKTPLTNSVMKRLYERLRRKTGVQHLTNHVCRHTFVTRMCEKGISPKAIAQIIGHAKTDYVMDIYAMIEKKQLQKEIHKLEDNEPKEQKQQNRMVELPSAVYTIASAYAETAGLTVDALISKAIMHSISEKLLK